MPRNVPNLLRVQKTWTDRYSGDNHRRLFLKDGKINIIYLYDTDSDISIIPASFSRKKKTFSMTLSAANTSSINVYGEKLLTLDFNLRKKFRYPFIIGDVSTSIIGAEFLCYYNVIPDFCNKKLVKSVTILASPGQLHTTSVPSMKTASGNSIYHKLLKFPDFNIPPRADQTIKHFMFHHIESTGRKSNKISSG